MDLYIYYRVDTAHATTLFGKIKGVQAMLQARLGIAGGLKRRPGEQEGLQTWMEIYQGILPSGLDEFTATLARALEDSGAAALISGQRHVEQFEDVAPCA
ncbi:hypothetical protein GWL_20720 [Herbaspirillum sp. GW103]|uniref:DUF4936 family protein n=1 Tax=unclassified Herbaspirillum TaxID=2624150 RepID=UPI00025E437F|nr:MULTISPECIES: DUF4936 family protein [unclassified Herbaspirillum]EIJ47831.1 hypothetical protein GWL_20720 [Herbaspirillum sp. GW103]MCI1005829.1 DUF4936 family protein [Herbaspirillum sp. C7C8]